MKKFLALTLVLCCLAGVAMADTFGMAVVTEVTSSSAAYVEDGDTYEGKFELETVVCAVVLDDNGVIKSVRFDMTQVKTKVSPEGAVNKVAGDTFASKVELKEAYGMKAYVPTTVGEWYEQAAALEQFCIGKTVAELKALPLTEGGVLDVADLKTSCTIEVSYLLEALELAAANAR